MQGLRITVRAWAQLASLVAMTSFGAAEAMAAKMAGDPAATCSDLIRPADNAVRIESATMVGPTPRVIAEKGPTPAARVTPANPEFCKVLGQIAPSDPKAPPIKFQVNLPVEWNGRSLQYGGGGFNGVLITGLGLPPAYPFDKPSPLARGFVTYGTDSGHETKPGEPPQALCAQRRGLREFRASLLQEGARRRRCLDDARLRQAAGETVLHGIVGRRPRGR